MQSLAAPSDRRRFLQAVLCVSTTVLVAGCGGGGAGGGGSVPVSSAGTAVPAPVTSTTQGSHPLNAALTLAYLGAQYHGYAARGAGLPPELTGGIGRQGVVVGARQAAFADASIQGHAAELADDKQAHVVALRNQIGALAAAQPQLDLSTAATGGFATAAAGAGLAAARSFDPYAGDQAYLIGAFLVENVVAAANRTLLMQDMDAGDQAVIQAHLADAIYHGGLIRSLLDDRASADASVDPMLAGISTMLAALDGTNVGDQTLAGASGASANLVDADGLPIPFMRTNAQVLKALYMSSSGVGGFLPAGANGIPA